MVTALRQWRGRLPFVVFVILLILCLILLGFACACGSDHHSQAIDRAIFALPPLYAVWSLLISVLIGIPVVVSMRRTAFGRASPADLQRFLF
jgi:hypothetical protein